MQLVVGTWNQAWGHTWVTRGFGKVYALRSLAGGSALCVTDEAILSGKGPVICRPGTEGWISYPTPGEHSCHITLLEKQAVVADYTSGTLSLYPLDKNGMATGAPNVIHFEEASHIHSSWLSPEGQWIIVADLGVDMLYRFAVKDGCVLLSSKESFPMPKGCGPRHCCFGQKVLYVSTEFADDVLVLSWPEMDLLQRSSVNPKYPHGGGHIVLSPDGRSLYVSSRLKNDGIGIFKVLKDGRIEKTGYCNTGLHPRHFCISPDGKMLIVACRDSNVIECYHRNCDDGSLTYAGIELSIEKPVYVDVYEESRL